MISIRKTKIWFIPVSLVVFLYSCGLFLSPFSPESYKNFTQLKVQHIKFIENHTERPGAGYDSVKINESFEALDTKFREAIEFEKSVTGDETRLKAFQILYEEFKANHQMLVNRGKLFGGVFAEQLISEIEANYNLAIKGELSRRDAPNN